MAARAIWKGVIKIGSSSVPVKLYSAVEDQAVHFQILDAKGLEPVKQRMVEPESENEVAYAEIRKGLEVEPGVFVSFDKDELAGLEPKDSRDIEVTRFVPAKQIHQQWYDRPYYLGPDGDGDDYFALAQALEESGQEGIARWVMRKKSYVGALCPKDGYLALVTLRRAEEVVRASDLDAPGGRALDSKEMDMANQLISALEDEFRPEDYEDHYRERVRKFIEAKAKGHAPKLKLVPKKKEADSLANALAASLKQIKRQGGKAVA